MRTLISALVLVSAVLAPRPARAESASPPDTGACASSSIDVLPASGLVPANLRRIRIEPGWVNVALVHRGSGAQVDGLGVFLARGTLWELGELLMVGETYDLERTDCPSAVRLATYEATEARPDPVSLGVITGELEAYYVRPGRRDRYHYVDVTLTRDPSLDVWLDDFDWWLAIDEPAPVTDTDPQSLRELVVRVPVDCSDRASSVGVRATGRASVRPGVLAELVTPELDFSTACADAVVVDADTGRPLTPDEIAELERLADTDAYREGADAHVALDGGRAGAEAGAIDGGSASMPTEPDTNPNCSCAASAPRWPSPTSTMLLLLFASGVLRRGARPRARARQASSIA